MKLRSFVIALVLSSFLCCYGEPGTPVKQQTTKPADTDSPLSLSVVNTVVVQSEPPSAFGDPLRCDADGNLYVRALDGEVGLTAPVKKIDSKGSVKTNFAVESIPDSRTWGVYSFAVGTKGDVYELLQLVDDPSMYVVVFGKDGSFKSKVKLDARIFGTQMAVFPSGELLVTGREQTATEVKPAFTGLFKDDGTLIKRIALADDKKIQEAVELGDATVSDPGRPGSNLAVSLGQAVAGQDGNIYVMRRTAAALIYALSSSGSVVHRFVVESPDPQMAPIGLQASANRLVVLFRNEHTKEQLLDVIDMESGDPVARFKADGLGSALACYMADDNRFVFLTNKNDKMAFEITEPQ